MTEHRRHSGGTLPRADNPWTQTKRLITMVVIGYLVLIGVLGWWTWAAIPGRVLPVVLRSGILATVVTLGLLLAIRTLVQRRLVMPLQHQADHDDLTGLLRPGRFWVRAEEQLAQALATHVPLAFAFFDLDDFKQLNDTRGHAVGDAVLRTFGQLAQSHARQHDTLGRLGGEEFGWVMLGATVAEAAQAVERLLAIYRTTRVDGVADLSFSAGVAGFVDLTAAPPSTWDLARWADHALYHAKATGKGRVVVWSKKDSNAPSDLRF